jgi:hypothetical protein
LSQVDIDAVDAFLLGKKFDGNGDLVVMTAQEAQDQLDGIESSKSPLEGQILTPRDFMKRFTQAEKDAIYAMALTDSQVMQIKDDLIAATHIDLLDPDLATGMAVFVSKSLITQARSDTILTI